MLYEVIPGSGFASRFMLKREEQLRAILPHQLDDPADLSGGNEPFFVDGLERSLPAIV